MLDAKTFTNTNVINYLNENFINLKIDAETEYGNKLFVNFSGKAYPLILFLDKNKNEIDRFYGFLNPDEFIIKLNEISSGTNTFPNLLKQYELGDKSVETISLLAKKYADQGNDSIAIQMYKMVLESKNVSAFNFHEAKYYLASQLLWGKGPNSLEVYLNKYPDSPFLKDGINQLLAYLKNNNETDKELVVYEKYLNIFSDDAWFLNQFAWRMTEINKNLLFALEKINIALNLLNNTEQGYADIIDTKAEILWKLGRINDALLIIEQAINLEPQNEYYKIQKEKILNLKH